MTLWDRLHELRRHPNFYEKIQDSDEWLDLNERRRAEIASEMPVPFCCTIVAGSRIVFAGGEDYNKSPTWKAVYQDHRGQGHIPVEVFACPFCGTTLPPLVLKKSPPPHVCRTEDYNYCKLCYVRLNECICSHPFSAYEPEGAPEIFAVTALVDRIPSHNKFKFLSVSRKDDPADLGLPGGKVDPGETPAEALVRELREETGLIAVEFHPVFDANDTTDKRCLTYHVTKFEGTVGSKEKGVVQWVTRKDLTEEGLTFAAYNQALFQHLDPYNRNR